MSPPTLETDVFVIGGGPAGLAAAIAARGRGFRVTIAERQRPPIDKACGEGLMPDAVAALGKLGVEFAVDEAMPFRGIRFLDGQIGLSTEAAFSNGVGQAIRRARLHSKLFQRAIQAGALLLWGANVEFADAHQLECDGARVNCRWIVGADGLQSQVRSWAGLNAKVRRPSRFGFTQHFETTPWTDFVEVYWGANCQAAVTPTGAKEIGIAVLSREPRMRLQSALQQMPLLAERLRNATPTSRERGAPCALRKFPRVHRDRRALIGDASGSVDPVTGEGLGLSFRQALALADALHDGNLESYQAAHRRIAQHSHQMSRLILCVDRHSWLRGAAMRALSSEPALFGRMLETNMGERNASSMGAGALRLGWRMARLAWPF